MEIVILPDSETIGRITANAIEELIARKPGSVLGLATGSSPLSVYDELARRYREEGLSFASARAFALDEYVGLPVGHTESYREVINREFTNKVDIPAENVSCPDGTEGNIAASGEVYEKSIQAAGGVDLQILGIGSNGHIGFNEPGSSLSSRTRVKTLLAQTRQDNARFFDNLDDVPRHVVTQGLGTIMEARHIVLIACGIGKAQAVRAFAEGPVSAFCPASVLQMHPHVTVLTDEEAASSLQLSSYYRETYANKPTWQSI